MKLPVNNFTALTLGGEGGGGGGWQGEELCHCNMLPLHLGPDRL